MGEVENLSNDRWIMVLIFLVAGAANALFILSWSPVIDMASSYFDQDTTAINLFAVMFQIMFVPGTLLLWSQQENNDMRGLVFQGALLTMVGSMIRYLGVIPFIIVSPLYRYIVVILGTAMVALAQPYYLTLPAQLAGLWFGLSERDVATTICCLANPLGSAIGSLIPSMVLTQENDESDVKGVDILLLIQLAIATAAFTLVALCFKAKPAQPPTRSAEKVAAAANAASHNISVDYTSAYYDILSLIDNTPYVCLFIAFAIGLAHLNALAALLGQLPGDYSSVQAGGLGAILIMCGFTGAFVTGFILDATKSYRTFLQIVYTFILGAWIFFLYGASSSFGLAAAGAGVLGWMMLSMVPAALICAVEAVYPISANLAVGALYCGANLLAIPFTFLGALLLSTPSGGASAPFYPYGIWALVTTSIGVIAVFFFKGTYKRLEDDQTEALLVSNSSSKTTEI